MFKLKYPKLLQQIYLYDFEEFIDYYPEIFKNAWIQNFQRDLLKLNTLLQQKKYWKVIKFGRYMLRIYENDSWFQCFTWFQPICERISYAIDQTKEVLSGQNLYHQIHEIFDAEKQKDYIGMKYRIFRLYSVYHSQLNFHRLFGNYNTMLKKFYNTIKRQTFTHALPMDPIFDDLYRTDKQRLKKAMKMNDETTIRKIQQELESTYQMIFPGSPEQKQYRSLLRMARRWVKMKDDDHLTSFIILLLSGCMSVLFSLITSRDSNLNESLPQSAFLSLLIILFIFGGWGILIRLGNYIDRKCRIKTISIREVPYKQRAIGIPYRPRETIMEPCNSEAMRRFFED